MPRDVRKPKTFNFFRVPLRLQIYCTISCLISERFSPFCYRPQRSWGKVIFSEACVKNSVHSGGVHGRGGGGHVRWLCGGGACVVVGEHAWQGCVLGGMHGGGHVWQGACIPRMPPPGHHEIRSVNARAVRILLECILVLNITTNRKRYFWNEVIWFSKYSLHHSSFAQKSLFWQIVILFAQQICKHFLDAVENSKYGWFWECPGGPKCHYKHALPPGKLTLKQTPQASVKVWGLTVMIKT